MPSLDSKQKNSSFICEDCGISVFLNKDGCAECFCCGKVYSRKEAKEQILMELQLRENDLFRLNLLPTNAKEIIPYQFKGKPDLKTVMIPGSVETIGESAFEGCIDLKKVVILDGVRSIGTSAFKDCAFLEEIEILSSGVSLGDAVFKNCSSIKRIEIQDDSTKINSRAFDKSTLMACPDIIPRIGCWGDFTGKEWCTLLSKHPEYAQYCGLTPDSSVTYWKTKLTVNQWKTLADKNPIFQAVYDLRMGCNVVQYLAKQPGMAKFCYWDEVSGTEWVNLLKENGLSDSLRNQGIDLLELCPWDKKFSKQNWVDLLSARPEYADRCNWDEFSDRNLKDLSAYGEQLWAHVAIKQLISFRIIDKMQWGKYRDWSDVKSGRQWCDIINNYPGLAAFCNWSSFSPEDWLDLLLDHPEFQNKCTTWAEFNKDDWVKLLTKHPEFKEKCPAGTWDEFDKDDWIELLTEHSEFEDKCPARIWKELNLSEWKVLLPGHPSYGDHIPSDIRFALNMEKAWNTIKRAVCYVFDDGADECIPIIVLLVFTFVSLPGETGWIALFAHSPKHALISGAAWIVAAALCFIGIACIWYDFLQNRWLYLWHTAFTSFSLYTFFHWSFFFSRWSWGLVICMIISLLLIFLPVVESGKKDFGLHFLSFMFIPYFAVFSWIVLSPVSCSGWLITTIVLLFIVLGFFTCRNDDEDLLKNFVFSCIPTLIIGIWCFLSPISSDACYKMANSLKTSFPRASQAMIQKGVSADPDYLNLKQQIDYSSR